MRDYQAARQVLRVVELHSVALGAVRGLGEILPVDAWKTMADEGASRGTAALG